MMWLNIIGGCKKRGLHRLLIEFKLIVYIYIHGNPSLGLGQVKNLLLALTKNHLRSLHIYIYILQYDSTKDNQVNNFKSEQKKRRIHFDQAKWFFFFFIYGIRT